MENLFKGTKGKWAREGTVVVSMESKCEIADVWAPNDLPHHEWNDKDWVEAKANAQLMATAPELLSVLIKLVKEVNETVAIGCPTFYAEHVIQKALKYK